MAMTFSWVRGVALLFAVAACGNDPTNQLSGDAGADSNNPFAQGHTLIGVALSPPNATLDIINDAVVTQVFTAKAQYADGSSESLSNSQLSWSSSFPAAGLVDATGTLTPTTQVGGPIVVTATYQTAKGSANVAVNLHYTTNPANASSSVQFALQGATQKDGACTWAYPYDGTVFPRGLAAPLMMWNGSGASDVYYLHLTSTYFDLKSFVSAPAPSQFAMDATMWTKFVESTSGKSELVMNRWDGNAATTLADQHWTIAPASMRGTIYYWANNLGRVMRIKPGATAPDDFANQAPLNDPNQYAQSSCLMTCHTAIRN